MSGLAALLAGPGRTPGIYRWHGAFDVADVRHTVEHAGWRFAYVDGWHGEAKAGVPAPAWARRWTSPTTTARTSTPWPTASPTSVTGREGVVLLWDGWGPFARDGRAGLLASPSACSASRVNADRGGPFAVLLRGDGPDVAGVPSLD